MAPFLMYNSNYNENLLFKKLLVLFVTRVAGRFTRNSNILNASMKLNEYLKYTYCFKNWQKLQTSKIDSNEYYLKKCILVKRFSQWKIGLILELYFRFPLLPMLMATYNNVSIGKTFTQLIKLCEQAFLKTYYSFPRHRLL